MRDAPTVLVLALPNATTRQVRAYDIEVKEGEQSLLILSNLECDLGYRAGSPRHMWRPKGEVVEPPWDHLPTTTRGSWVTRVRANDADEIESMAIGRLNGKTAFLLALTIGLVLSSFACALEDGGRETATPGSGVGSQKAVGKETPTLAATTVLDYPDWPTPGPLARAVEDASGCWQTREGLEELLRSGDEWAVPVWSPGLLDLETTTLQYLADGARAVVLGTVTASEQVHVPWARMCVWVRLLEFQVRETVLGEVPENLRIVLWADVGPTLEEPYIQVHSGYDLSVGGQYLLFLKGAEALREIPGLSGENYEYFGGRGGIWTVIGDWVQPRLESIGTMRLDEVRRGIADGP